MKRRKWQFMSVAIVALLLLLLFFRRDRPRQPTETVQAASVFVPAPLLIAASPVVAPTPAAPAAVTATTAVKPNDFEAFNSWLEAYFAAPSPAAKAALLDTGEQLAKARRQEMVRLIKTDPEHALELAVSYSLRKHLPPRVNGLLEERVS